jgi:glycosyltransferase involved in cell wall biosynthesis
MNQKILEVCLSPGLGGLELFTLHCHNYFSQKGECHIVVAPDKKLDKYIKDTDKLYIKRNKFFPFIPSYKLAKYIDERDIDVLHFHWNRDMITVVLAKILSTKKPSIILSRHMGMTRFKDDFYHRWLYKHISTIHAVSRQVQEQLIKYIPSSVRPNIDLIYLGVSPKKESDPFSLKNKYKLKDEFIVGIIGRMQEGKDQHIVIEAISKLKDLNIKLFIIGEAMDEQYLQKLHHMCEEMDLEERVIFTGFTKEADAYMQLCDITVLATKNETFGLVIIESMANGTPVIATDRGGPLEIINDGVDGLLYDGSSEDLSKKIQRLYTDKLFKEKLALNSLKKVSKQFDRETQLEKLYQSIQEMNVI